MSHPQFKKWIKDNRPDQERNLNAVSWEFIEEMMKKAYRAGYVQANVEVLAHIEQLESEQ